MAHRRIERRSLERDVLVRLGARRKQRAMFFRRT